jgi:holo-[acyl-carrier protein] synthase
MQMKQPIIGIDLIEIHRIQESISRWGERFLKRIYTEAELKVYRDKIESLAARFAAKEAVMKALNVRSNSISWQEIEVLASPSGKPEINLSGKAANQAHELGLCGFEISLSHTKENAVAIVIGIQED